MLRGRRALGLAVRLGDFHQLGEVPLRQDREVEDGLVHPHHTVGTVG